MITEPYEEKNIRPKVGRKEALRAITSGKAYKVMVARNAEPRVVIEVIDECRTRGIRVEYVDDMTELGKAFCIDVGASVVALTGLQIQDPHL